MLPLHWNRPGLVAYLSACLSVCLSVSPVQGGLLRTGCCLFSSILLLLSGSLLGEEAEETTLLLRVPAVRESPKRQV